MAGSRSRTAAVLVVLVAAGALLATGCGTVGRVEGGDAGQGRQLFVKNCGSCHSLADAGTAGTIGPNLDEAFKYARSQKFNNSTIEDVVRGHIAYPTPPMPKNLVTGDDADSVAVYVASVAGKPSSGKGGQI